MNLSGNEQGKAIINICPTKFIFKQNSGNVDEIVDFFHLADGTKQFLTTAEPGECVMNINNNNLRVWNTNLGENEKKNRKMNLNLQLYCETNYF